MDSSRCQHSVRQFSPKAFLFFIPFFSHVQREKRKRSCLQPHILLGLQVEGGSLVIFLQSTGMIPSSGVDGWEMIQSRVGAGVMDTCEPDGLWQLLLCTYRVTWFRLVYIAASYLFMSRNVMCLSVLNRIHLVLLTFLIFTAPCKTLWRRAVTTRWQQSNNNTATKLYSLNTEIAILFFWNKSLKSKWSRTPDISLGYGRRDWSLVNASHMTSFSDWSTCLIFGGTWTNVPHKMELWHLCVQDKEKLSAVPTPYLELY